MSDKKNAAVVFSYHLSLSSLPLALLQTRLGEDAERRGEAGIARGELVEVLLLEFEYLALFQIDDGRRPRAPHDEGHLAELVALAQRGEVGLPAVLLASDDAR